MPNLHLCSHVFIYLLAAHAPRLDVFQGAMPLAPWKRGGLSGGPGDCLGDGGGWAAAVGVLAAPDLFARRPPMDPVHVAAFAIKPEVGLLVC